MIDPVKNGKSSLDAILGQSEAIRVVKSLIRQVSPSDITILIAGESGTGKELVARAIHDLSPRHKRPLMTLNCGAIPEGIFESEIFGHEKGSFTSADQKRRGYFELADGGSLFLDEIGEMPLQIQVKFLRVLETGTFLRVGGSIEVNTDVRLIAATNKDLTAEVAKGRFRRDLYFRLKAVSLVIPPLRERIDDIPILVSHFIRQFARRNHKPKIEFEPDALLSLKRHYWEGNVRELKNVVESICALVDSPRITAEDLDRFFQTQIPSSNLPMIVTQPKEELDRELLYRTLLEIRQEITAIRSILKKLAMRDTGEFHRLPTNLDVEELIAASEGQLTRSDRQEPGENMGNPHSIEDIESYSLADIEKEQILKVLQEFDGNRRLAARALGIGERTLYRKIKQYNLR